jgi:transposase
LQRDKDRTPCQQAIQGRPAQLWEPFQIARMLARGFWKWFVSVLEPVQTATFRQWLADSLASSIGAMRNFGASLQQDQGAVEAGLSSRWSNVPVEGSNNHMKFLKRRGYGRAHFDPLRCRVLQRA